MTQIFDLGKLRFHFRGVYSPETEYELNDVVKFGGGCYVFTHVLKTTGTSPANESHWGHLSSGTVYQGEYNSATEYAAGDIVSFGANVFFCTVSNTGKHPTDPANASFWVQYSEGLRFVGEYDVATPYFVGDLVRIGAAAFVALGDTEGNLPELGSAHWALFSEGTRFVGNYDEAVQYTLGDIARVGGQTYTARATSLGINPDEDPVKWNLLADGLTLAGRFDPAATYVPGEIVHFGANAYITLARSTGVFPTDATKYELMLAGSGVPTVWDEAKADYAINEQATVGSLLYAFKGDGYAAVGESPELNAEWVLVSAGTEHKGVYVAGTTYLKGEIVLFGPNAFLRTATGESLDLEAEQVDGLWVPHAHGIRWTGVPVEGRTYYPGDVIGDYTNSYVCKKKVTLGANPDFSDAGNESSNWDIVSRGQEYFPHPVPADYGSTIASTAEGGFLLTRKSVTTAEDLQAVIYQDIYVDTEANEEAITITLPVANEYSKGISVTIHDAGGYADALPIMVKTPDGARIDGQDDAEFHLDIPFGSVHFVFFNTTQGWKVL